MESTAETIILYPPCPEGIRALYAWRMPLNVEESDLQSATVAARRKVN